MRKLLSILLLLPSIGLMAQDKTYPSVANVDEQLLFSLYSDVWSGLPPEVDPDLINRGYSMHLFYDRPLSTSNFSMAFGIGWEQHNLYSNAYPASDKLLGQGRTVFYLVPSRVGVIPIEYTLNKMCLNYLSVPIELRYRSRSNLKFKFSLGVSGGVLVSSFMKYKGSDYLGDPEEKVKWKRYGIPNALPYTYGATMRIGVRQWGLKLHYQVPSVFGKEKGPDVRPLSFGLTYNPA